MEFIIIYYTHAFILQQAVRNYFSSILWKTFKAGHLMIIFCCFFRLVMSDVAYYMTSLRALPGLVDLDVGVDDIWDDSWSCNYVHCTVTENCGEYQQWN